MRKALAIIVEAEPGLLPPGAFQERFVKPLPALGVSLVFQPFLEQTVEAENLATGRAFDDCIVLGRIRFVNREGFPALATSEGE